MITPVGWTTDDHITGMITANPRRNWRVGSWGGVPSDAASPDRKGSRYIPRGLGVLRPSSRAAVSPGPHPITMSYHSDHALATQPPFFGSSVGYRERLLRVLMLLPELSHAVTARHQLDTFDPSNRSREGVSRSERKPGPSHVYGRRPPKLEVGAARTQRFAPAAVAVFYSGGRPCGSVRFHS